MFDGQQAIGATNNQLRASLDQLETSFQKPITGVIWNQVALSQHEIFV